jgi:hypothetical protein
MVNCIECNASMVPSRIFIERLGSYGAFPRLEEKDACILFAIEEHITLNGTPDACSNCKAYYEEIISNDSVVRQLDFLHGIGQIPTLSSDTLVRVWPFLQDPDFFVKHGSSAYETILRRATELLPEMTPVHRMIYEECLALYSNTPSDPTSLGVLCHAMNSGDPWESYFPPLGGEVRNLLRSTPSDSNEAAEVFESLVRRLS